MVLDRWPHSQETRKENSGGLDVTEAASQGGSQERGKNEGKSRKIVTPAARKGSDQMEF